MSGAVAVATWPAVFVAIWTFNQAPVPIDGCPLKPEGRPGWERRTCELTDLPESTGYQRVYKGTVVHTEWRSTDAMTCVNMHGAMVRGHGEGTGDLLRMDWSNEFVIAEWKFSGAVCINTIKARNDRDVEVMLDAKEVETPTK